jgi:hypothetical protein
MNMKQHILAALSEVCSRWEDLLAGLDEGQITAALAPTELSVKDVIAHLWAWQQRSIARMEAAALNQEPAFPAWQAALDPDGEGTTDQVNTWIFETYRDQPWPKVHQNWREGFQQFLTLAQGISERDLLDSGKYAWLHWYPLAWVLLSSYDHHQGHFEKLEIWLRERGRPGAPLPKLD